MSLAIRFAAMSAILAAMTGCASMVQSSIDQTVSTLRYAKDPRTGLCFAMTPAENNWAVTNVPCAPVEALIEADRHAATSAAD